MVDASVSKTDEVTLVPVRSRPWVRKKEEVSTSSFSFQKYLNHVRNNASVLLRDYTLLAKSYKRFLLCKKRLIHHLEE